MTNEKKRSISDYHIGVRDLKNHLTKIVSTIREYQSEYIVTVHGQPVAILRPYTEADTARIEESVIDQELADIQALSELVTDAWASSENGVAVLEKMREDSSWR